MNFNFTVKSYYVFMFLLPLIYLYGISDLVLLPRQLFLSAFCLLLGASLWQKFRKDVSPVNIDAAHVAILIYFLIAVVVSISNAKVFSESLYALSKLWIAISFLLLTGLLLNYNVITVNHIIKGVILFGCTAIMTGLIDMYKTTLPGQHLFRKIQDFSGGFANKNLLSSILFLCLPFFMIGLHGKRPLKITSIVALVLALFILAILRTRVVLVATFIFFAIIVTLYLKEIIKRKLYLAVVIIVPVSVFLLFRFSETFQKMIFPSDVVSKYFSRVLSTKTLKERILFWENSMEMIKDYPLGVGLGNWQIYFPKYGLEKFNSFEIVNGLNTVQRPHNDFIWSLCETGIFGFVAYVSVFAIVFYKLIKLIFSATDKYHRWMFVYLIAGLVGFVIISFIDFPMERIEHQIVLMLLFAVVIHQYRSTSHTAFTISIKKQIVMLFLTLGVFFSLTIGFVRLNSEKDVYRMNIARQVGNHDGIVSLVENAEGFLYKIDSKTIPLEWYKGVAKFSQQQFAESEECFQKAYKLTPFNIHVINNLASNYEENGKRPLAITFYSKALQISPMFEEARLNLAAVYFNDKNYEMAFRTIDLCDVNTKDPKYKIFLPPILKAKVNLVLHTNRIETSEEIIKKFKEPEYNLQVYNESKKNNITFERQIIRNLNNKI